MSTTIFPSYDGVVYKFVTDTWANTRKANGGTLNVTSSYYIQNSHTSGRGGNTYQIGRYFLEFDTSSINKTITDATLKIYGNTMGTLDVILLKSSQTGAVLAGDFNEIANGAFPLDISDGSGAGSFEPLSGIKKYSLAIDTWSTSGYNDIALTDDAKADIIANDTFNCVLIGHDYDFRDIAPSEAWYRTQFYQDAIGGTSRDPYIEVEEQENSVFFGCNF
tara:strand:+ start:242 stop:901 length:660 start_codon:yes stop_codon:yes gene_type:complete